MQNQSPKEKNRLLFYNFFSEQDEKEVTGGGGAS